MSTLGEQFYVRVDGVTVAPDVGQVKSLPTYACTQMNLDHLAKLNAEEKAVVSKAENRSAKEADLLEPKRWIAKDRKIEAFNKGTGTPIVGKIYWATGVRRGDSTLWTINVNQGV